MRIRRLLLGCVARAASSQSLADILTSNSATLSTLNAWLSSQQLVYTLLSNAEGVTLLAPSNNALTQLYSSPYSTQLGTDPDLLTAFLSYHVLNGTYDISTLATSQSIQTLLDLAGFSNVTGGQRVVNRANNGVITLLSGNGAQSNVEGYDFTYANGVLHILDTVLTIPATLTPTLINAGLTATVGALRRAGVEQTLNDLPDVTIFAPNNAAFNAIGSLVDGMTADQLSSVLNYHVVQGKVLYSEMLAGAQASDALGGQEQGQGGGAGVGSVVGTEATAQGGNVSFRVENGGLFVNGARVVQPDLLVGNGVVHVVDAVLNPANSTATPNPTAATQDPAFNGASSTSGGVPFTSAVITTINTISPTISVTSVPTSGAAVPEMMGSVGIAAMFACAAGVWWVS